MDQKEIDELLKAGTFKDYNEKQEELIKNISDKSKRTPPPAPPAPPAAAGQDKEEIAPPIPTGEKQGRVMGQLSRVTEESEAGTNVVMEYMENVLSTISMQQGFIKDIRNKFREFPSEINIDEVLTFVNDSLCT
ncbi:MAG: hypothetical protein GY950_19605, partial [bacterium]|nr:hypothetical protein [bacterium]